MTQSSRRTFLAATGAAACAVVTARRGWTYQTADETFEIPLGQEIGTIRPELHAHFAEHLGSCIYGGIWVGKNSQIPNINGFRRAAVEYLRELGLVVLRWPGGCFADDYHWRDGIGPAEKRPKRVNIHWGNYVEDNSFGTHEFIEFCRLIGAEPYLAGNVGSGTPQEFRDWVEYCNYPSGSSLADERAANGSPEPFRVRYWGVGNENWGCGGNMRPEEYAEHFRRFTTYIRNFGGTQPFLIACGPNGNDANWTNGFFTGLARGGRSVGRVHGYAMHYYSGGRNTPTKFTVDEMYDQFSSFPRIEKAVLDQRALMDKYDPERRVGLMVDEWGAWDRMIPEEEKAYGRLWMQITMRTTICAALGLNVFHRQADKLVMCNIAQTVNVLHSLLLTRNEKCIRTPTYWAYMLAKPHRGMTALKVTAGGGAPRGLDVSVSKKEKDLVVTLVNPAHDTGRKVRASVAGGSVEGASARILTHADHNACNTFEQPDTIVPKSHAVTANGAVIEVDMPPLSIVTVQAKLA